MKIEMIDINGIDIARVISDNVEINSIQDALDLMADCSYQGARKIIIHESNVIPDFFDLKTGIAGDMLQKFSTYNVELAIIGDFSKYPGKSLKDFIYESNKAGKINFVNSIDHAIEALTSKQHG